jgi:hypothetical protein
MGIMNKKKYSSKHHGRFAFEKKNVINLDLFSGHRLLYWIGMNRNSLTVRRFVAEYYSKKFPDNVFWISVFKERGLI